MFKLQRTQGKHYDDLLSHLSLYDQDGFYKAFFDDLKKVKVRSYN
jgi:hypothetical protein